MQRSVRKPGFDELGASLDVMGQVCVEDEVVWKATYIVHNVCVVLNGGWTNQRRKAVRLSVCQVV